MKALPLGSLPVHITVTRAPASVAPGECFSVSVHMANRGENNLTSAPPNPVYFSYHWLDAAGSYEIFDGLRTPLPQSPANSSRDYDLSVMAPTGTGVKILRVTLVQEGIRWFDVPPCDVFHDQQITCRDGF